MKVLFIKIVLCTAMFSLGATLSAQGLLGKLKKTAESVTTETPEKETTASTTDKIKESEIPFYTCQKVYETDDTGSRLKNEDGTDKYRVFIIDRSGKKVSPEAVAAQTKQINAAILAIASKAAVGAGIGALNGGAKGALLGVATGLGLSVNDIKLVIKLKKDSNRQKKAIEAYQKSFDEEGNLVVAEIDKSTLKDLNIDESNSTNEATSKIKEELSKPEYASLADTESLDNLLAAATKA